MSDPWLEYDDAALWCAKRGIKGKTGDKLPDLLSAECHGLINEDPESFERRVRQTAYQITMEEVKRNE